MGIETENTKSNIEAGSVSFEKLQEILLNKFKEFATNQAGINRAVSNLTSEEKAQLTAELEDSKIIALRKKAIEDWQIKNKYSH